MAIYYLVVSYTKANCHGYRAVVNAKGHGVSLLHLINVTVIFVSNLFIVARSNIWIIMVSSDTKGGIPTYMQRKILVFQIFACVHCAGSSFPHPLQ